MGGRTGFAIGDPQAGLAAGNFWEASARVATPQTLALQGTANADIAIIGAGFAGLNAALRLADAHGMDVAVLEAGVPGAGASGRNGGFCCPGSAKRSWSSIEREFGREETTAFHAMQVEAVDHVRSLIATHAIDSTICGEGEIELAHSRRAAAGLRQEGRFLAERFGMACAYLEPGELAERGFGGTRFFGGLRDTVSFGLQPLDYVRGLARAAIAAGARIYSGARVDRIAHEAGRYRIATATGEVTAGRLFVATNGYTQDRLLPALSGRLLPALSRILVTRPLSEAEISAQGWRSADPAFDSRNLLHYFRLLPGRRMLFGGRGGLDPTPAGIARSVKKLRRRFEATFPAFADAETTHAWAGNVCLSARLLPHAGPIEGMENAWTALAWHGNGVAMASYSGRRMADVIAGVRSLQQSFPAPMRAPLARFPLPFLRKAYLAAAYAGYALIDEWG